MNMVRSVYRDMAKLLSPLFCWLGVGWAFFPTLALEVSETVGEPFDVLKAGMVAYPLSAVCFVLGAFFFLRWQTTLPVGEAYFEKLAKPRVFKCPYCGRRIGVDEVSCPYCKSEIPR